MSKKHPAPISIKQEGLACCKRARFVVCHEDVQVVDRQPAAVVVVANNEANAPLKIDEDVQLVGSTGPNALADFPHARQDCVTHPFIQDEEYCANCFCFVCDIPASDCKGWDLHRKAVSTDPFWQQERQKRKPIDLTAAAAAVTAEAAANPPVPDGLFDYDTEPESRFCPALRQKCANNKYHYTDSETFLAALELYNREGSVYRDRVICGQPIKDVLEVTRRWKCLRIAGRHRKPCDQCDIQFCKYNTHGAGEYYLTDTEQGDWYAKKACLGCMGRNLCIKYGTDKAAILAKLEPLRKTQGVSSLFDIKRYQDDYYNYATLFDGSDMHKYVT
jgi:hypothetical protein